MALITNVINAMTANCILCLPDVMIVSTLRHSMTGPSTVIVATPTHVIQKSGRKPWNVVLETLPSIPQNFWCLCATDVTSSCLHRAYSCGTVSPACKVRSGQLDVYIAVRYATPSGSARSERDSAASQRRRHEGGSSQGVSGRRRDLVASQHRGHEGGSSQGVSGRRRDLVVSQRRRIEGGSSQGVSERRRDSAASQRRGHEGGSSQGVSGRRRDSAANQRRGHEGGSSQGVSGRRRDSAANQRRGHEGGAS